MEIKKNALSLNFSHNVYCSSKEDTERIYVCLHGYLLDGKYMFETFEEVLKSKGSVLCPDGPFPVPKKKKDYFECKYAWYFFDPNTQNFYINFEPSADYLKRLIEEHNPKKLPVTLIGYSQGGYLAPKVAELVSEVDSVIGIACSFRNNRFNFREGVSYHQVNSKGDIIVDLEGAKSEFEILASKGNKGQFIQLESSGHRIDEDYISALKSLI